MHLRVVASAAIGSVVVFQIVRPLRDVVEGRYQLLDLFVAALLTLLVVASFLEPLGSRLQQTLSGTSHQEPVARERGRLALLAVGFGIVAFKQLAERAIDEAAFVGALVAGLLIVGPTTHFWVHGAQRRPPKAALFGGLAAFTGGALLMAFVLWSSGGVIDFGEGPTPEVTGAGLLVVAAVNGLNWALYGLAGGWVIDMRRGRTPSGGVAVALLGAVLGQAVLALVVFGRVPTLAFLLEELGKVLGWAAGLFAYAPADVLLRAPRPADS